VAATAATTTTFTAFMGGAHLISRRKSISWQPLVHVQALTSARVRLIAFYCGSSRDNCSVH
jgi:hypothetical protein